MKNRGFTLTEMMVVASIVLGLAGIIFSIFILLNNSLARSSSATDLKQRAQIALNAIANNLERSSAQTITIEECAPGDCSGEKITFQIPVVDTDAISGTVFTDNGTLKLGTSYPSPSGGYITVRNGYFSIYAGSEEDEDEKEKLIEMAWHWIEQGDDPGCFLAGTPVLMADGSTKPIEAIKAGDEVLAYNEKTGKTQIDKVKKLLIHNNAKRYLIINGKLKVTSEHRFYSEGKWINIGRLKIGDKLLNYKTKTQAITSIKAVEEKNTVYNLETAPSHNYFAGGFLVHNAKDLEGEGNFPWGKLFHNIFADTAAYADQIMDILIKNVITTGVDSINFTGYPSDTGPERVKIKIRTKGLGAQGQPVLYNAETEIVPLN